ncbi:uncharacterized protein EI90DRAFT_2903076 [Cantharellus anzutake]|uniref:uncharacterized protein n=1 Tax=Cantharellus anzutake TaxID=1750568 RepID=UPI001903BD7A|nr:uncharacterized protein EI90DRAFT_2903076 [Cantharellus anzutake]KAF8342561.1 hypothetical protein EI90DRAFT_2903076 [Cantharellus anzutake]
MGVAVETITPGDGKVSSTAGNRVTIEYTGMLADGTFDIAHGPGSTPLTIQIGTGAVIRGLDEGITQLSLGQRVVLWVTPEYGYGSRGFPPVIPANAPLRLEVCLIKIN